VNRYLSAVAILFTFCLPSDGLGQILYTDIEDFDLGDGVFESGSFLVDLDQDGIDDVNVVYSDWADLGFHITLLTGGQNQSQILTGENLSTRGVAFEVGTLIDGTAFYAGYEWSAPIYSEAIDHRFSSHFGTPSRGFWGFNFTNSLDQYIPIRIPKDGNWHYAWLKVTVPRGTRFAVDSWGYETSPNTPIVAGAIPEPSVYVTVILGSILIGLAHLRRRKATCAM